MSHFLVYIPKARGQSQDHLQRVGLKDFWSGSEFVDVAKGPDGQSGVLIAWRGGNSRDMRFCYAPDQQEWIPAVARDGLPAARYYLGFWRDSRPTSLELQRRTAFRGRAFILGDGQEWIVPRISELPHDIVYALDGSLQFAIQRKYHEFSLECDRWLLRLSEGTNPPLLLEAAEFCFRGLQINYRLPFEIAFAPPGSGVGALFTKDNVGTPFLTLVGAGGGAGGGGGSDG